jgi:IS5 family transposase
MPCFTGYVGSRSGILELCSLHEPEVQCISKGKTHKRYEFGQKVAVASTNCGNWMVAAKLLPDNPYDGHTLAETLTAVQAVTGVAVTDAYVDKGYRGHGCTHTVNVHLPGQRSGVGSRAERRRRRRRSAIEPKTCPEPRRIGHLKPALSREGACGGLPLRSCAGSDSRSVLPDRRACCAAAADGDFFRDD